ncbi:MAG: ribosome assembly RNA-binding protein YhbY [Desulfobacterales bacterium]
MLSGFQKKYLKGLAHGLKPVVFIGQAGLTDAVIENADAALKKHELVKVKFIAFKEKNQKSDLIAAFGRRTAAELVGSIGHTAIFFRPHPENGQNRIVLPTRP